MNKSKTTTKNNKGNKLAQMIVCILCATVLLFSCSMFFGFIGEDGGNVVASAAEFDSGAQYAKEFQNNGQLPNGWKQDIITDVDPNAKVEGKYGEGLVGQFADFCMEMGKVVIMLSIFASVLRFAGRGICAILGLKKGDGFLWKMIAAPNERKANNSVEFKEEWVFPMLKSTAFLMLIGVGSGFLVMFIASVTGFVIGKIVGTAGSAGYGQFNVSGISVQTSGVK